MISNFFVTEIY